MTGKHGSSLVVQWLRLQNFTAEGQGSIPDWGTKIPHAAQCSQKKKKRNDLHRNEVGFKKKKKNPKWNAKGEEIND